MSFAVSRLGVLDYKIDVCRKIGTVVLLLGILSTMFCNGIILQLLLY